MATSFKGTIYFTSTDPKATLPYTSQSEYTFTTGSKGDKGVHTFSGFILATAGSQTITVTSGSISAATSVITVNPATPISIQISPTTATVTAGSNQAYTATATDFYGNSWSVTALTSWSITAGAGGSWSGNVYTSATTGTWTITGGYLGLYDTASLTVNHATATSITINPNSASVKTGSHETYTALASDVYGNSWDVTNLATWSASSGACGSWSNNVYTSNKAGTVVVTAKMGSLSSTAMLTEEDGPAVSITISPQNPAVVAGHSQTFTATASDSDGNTWDVSSSTVWIIDSGAGGSWSGNVYTSDKAGTWTVYGVYDGLLGTASLTVDDGPVSSIVISPATATLSAGSSQTFTATATDVFGNTWSITSSVDWSISSGAGGSWSGNTYTSAVSGQWIVTGSYSGVSDTASLTVNHGTAVNIAVGSTLTSVTAGTIVVYTTTAIDSFGNTWDATGSTVWIIDSGAGGSWSGNVYTSDKAGTWTITGVYGELSDKASLTVTPAVPISLTVSPQTSSLAAGFSQSYSAVASDVYGNSWGVTDSATWSTSTGAGGSWSRGVYTSAIAGTWTITGAYGGLSNIASLTVNPGYPVKIEVNPSTSTIVAGSTQTFTATAFDYFGNSWDITSSTSFSVDVNAGGSLSDNVYTSANAGTWTVTVMGLGLSGTATLIVTHASPVSITVDPNSASITAGSSQAFTATASDSYGNVWDVTALTEWSVSSGAGGSWANNQYTSAIAGNWIVTGTYTRLSNYAYLTVNHASAVTLIISPSTATITTGSNEAFTATATDDYNNVWDATPSTNWIIDSGAGGSWSGNVYSSITAGTWQVTGIYSGLSDTASLTVNHGAALSITVSPSSAALTAGSPQTFTATATDSNGNSWDETSSTSWSIDVGAGGSWVGNTYTSNNAGSWTVMGIYSGLSSTASVTVNHAPAASITVGPTSGSIIAGSTETFIATAADVYGNTWDVTPSTVWTIDAGAGGSFSGNVYTSQLAGVWSVTGTFGSLSKSVFLTVTHASALGIQVTPYSATIAAGSNEAFSTIAVDTFGNTWDVTGLASYSITSGAGGSWSANIYTPADAGTWTITATWSGFSATAPVTVIHGSPTSLVISPETQTIVAGSTQTFTATASDAYGNLWDVSSSTVWIIDSGAGGSWSANVFTSANSGNWIVTGVLDGILVRASLTINHGVVSSIVVSPASASINSGSSQSCTATAYDSEGNSWDVTNSVSWLTSAGAGGSWTGNVYTSLNTGSWTVTASSTGISGTTQLTVNSAQQFSPVDFYHTGTVGFSDEIYFLDGYIGYYQTGALNSACALDHSGTMDYQDIVLFLQDYNAALVATYGPASRTSPTPTP